MFSFEPVMPVFGVLEAVDAEDASRVVAAVSAAVGRLTHPEELAAGGRRIVQLTDLERSSITSATINSLNENVPERSIHTIKVYT